MKKSLIIFGLGCLLCSGCQFVSRVSEEVQKTAGDVKQGIDTTIKNTTDTINTAKEKVESVTNAVSDLQKSLGELGKWGNGNENTNSQ